MSWNEIAAMEARSSDAALHSPGLNVCVGASSGGHLAELMALTSQSARWYRKPSALIATLPVGSKLEARWGRVSVIGECNRRTWFRALAVMYRAWSAVRELRPDVFITTGSMPMLFVAAAVKLYGGRVVWIDSIARVDGLSMSAHVARSFADLCLSQWPEVAARYRGVDYAGEVF